MGWDKRKLEAGHRGGSPTAPHHKLLAFCGKLSLAALFMGAAWAQAQESGEILTFVERAEKAGTALRMSLRDAMRMALENNLNIAIQDYNEEISKQRISAAEYVYEPRFVGGITYSSVDSPNTSAFNRSITGNAFTQKTLGWSGGLTQDLPYGGSWQLDYNTNRIVLTPVTNSSLFTSLYRGGLTFTFRQPLIRNFKENPNFRRLKLVKLDDKINDTQFEEQVTNIIKMVQDAYWELVFAIKNQEIKKRSLELARIQLDNNKRKVEIGTLAPIAITEASAEVAVREQEMIASETQINNLQNNLKRLLSKDRDAQIWKMDIIPTESPEFKEVKYDMGEAIATALKNRPEIRRMQLNIDKVDVDYNFTRNQTKPRIDFVGSFGTIGVAGAPNPRPGLPVQLAPEFIGGLGNLGRQLFTADFINYSFGVQVDIPLRERSLQAQLAELSLQKRQIIKQQKDIEQQIQVEVRNALQALETNKKVVETARVGLRLAQEQLDGETKRFQAGLSMTFFVLQRQRDVAEAEGRLLRALIDYQKSLADLQKAMFVTIDKNDIEIARAQISAEKER